MLSVNAETLARHLLVNYKLEFPPFGNVLSRDLCAQHLGQSVRLRSRCRTATLAHKSLEGLMGRTGSTELFTGLDSISSLMITVMLCLEKFFEAFLAHDWHLIGLYLVCTRFLHVAEFFYAFA